MPRAVLAVLLVGWSAVAEAQRDFAPDNAEWNGLSELLAVAAEHGVQLEVVERLDVGTLGPSAALLVVGPQHEPTIDGLSALLRAGARIALADDHGATAEVLRAFRIDRHTPSGRGELALRGNDALLVARPIGPHALSLRVDALVTNHPMAIHHGELEPIFAFGESDALVLAGAVGTGRLVVISDPSVLINNMLELGGNRRFAANLLRYLAGITPGVSGDGPVRQVLLVPPDAPVVGRYGEPGADRPLYDLRSFLQRLGAVEIPGVGLRVLGAMLVLVFLLVASGALPRGSPYGARGMFPPAVNYGGMAGRIAWYGRPSADQLDPLLTYRVELEAELFRRLGLPASPEPDAVAGALVRRGVAEPEARAAVQLLTELEEVAARAERGTVEPVSAKWLEDVMRRGDALLAAVRRGAS